MPKTKLTYERAETMRALHKMGVTQARLAHDFHVDPATVWAVIVYRTFKRPEGPPRKQAGPIEPRFWAKVAICVHGHDCPYCCWDWQASTFKPHNYGAFRIGQQQRRAHCVSWELHNKQLLPNDLWCLHRCNRGICVNPDHLYAGTPKQNIEDRARSGISWRGFKHKDTSNHWMKQHPEHIKRGADNPHAKWSESEREKMRSLHKAGMRRVDIASQFNISLGGLDHILYPPKQ